MKALTLLSLLTVLSCSFVLFAESKPRIVSPDVQPDGHVTFRFSDPRAVKVSVSIEGQETPTPMQKDEYGIWNVTVGMGVGVSWPSMLTDTFTALGSENR